MTRVREGEQSALELLFARWEAPLFAFFYRLGCPPGSVEDLTEEVLVAIYRHRHRYDPARPFPPWLYGIARLVWRDYLRHRRREISRTALLEAAEDVRAPEPDPSESAQSRETAHAILQAVEQLPDELRLTFTLRHYQGLSYADIAEALRLPLGTVKWRIHEAVRRLRGSRAAADREV
ncbi:MAG TPA: RNA polymerase sigma factor [Candidatus Binatia bacterium]|nr:RNA polymerase sigma factor [Candidatus Binatia bacterium]